MTPVSGIRGSSVAAAGRASRDETPLRHEAKTESGRALIYEHRGNGDVFIVPDPQLRLDELQSVQNEVANLLRAGAHH